MDRYIVQGGGSATGAEFRYSATQQASAYFIPNSGGGQKHRLEVKEFVRGSSDASAFLTPPRNVSGAGGGHQQGSMIEAAVVARQRNFGLLRGKTPTQPVAGTPNSRARVVTILAEEYERLKRRDRQVFRSEEAPDALAEAILAARPPEAADSFDHEVG